MSGSPIRDSSRARSSIEIADRKRENERANPGIFRQEECQRPATFSSTQGRHPHFHEPAGDRRGSRRARVAFPGVRARNGCRQHGNAGGNPGVTALTAEQLSRGFGAYRKIEDRGWRGLPPKQPAILYSLTCIIGPNADRGRVYSGTSNTLSWTLTMSVFQIITSESFSESKSMIPPMFSGAKSGSFK